MVRKSGIQYRGKGGLIAAALGILALGHALPSVAQSIVSTPGNTAGWLHYSTRGNSANPADGSCTGCNPPGAVGPAVNAYVSGAATPPLGVGSLTHQTGDGTGGGGATGRGGRLWSTVDDLNGVRLADIEEIRYSTYTEPASPDSVLKTSIQLYVDLAGDGAAFNFANGSFPTAPPAANDALLIFEPVYTAGDVAASVQGAWQEWVITPSAGLWWDVRNNAATNAPCGNSGCQTLGQIVTAFPNARVYGFSPAQQAAPISGNTVVGAVTNGFLFASGSSGGAPWTNYSGNIDRVSFDLAGAPAVVYNFDIDVAPTLAYAPPTGTQVSFAGVTTIGSTGTASITITPSGGAGAGAGATTTFGGCTFGGADPGSFSLGAVTLPFSFDATSTTARSLPLTCTAAAAARSATLTCAETVGTAAPVSRSWPLSCPAGVNVVMPVPVDDPRALAVLILALLAAGGLALRRRLVQV